MSGKGLGQGLDALLGSEPPERFGENANMPVQDSNQAQVAKPTIVPIPSVRPNPNQPRTHFQEDKLMELAISIKNSGLVQPLSVRENPDGEGYEIIAGERRWRACQKAGLHEVPITILEVDNDELLTLAIVENIQRENLNPIEEAEAYHSLIEKKQINQDELANIVGKSRSHITNILRLRMLPESIKSMVQDGRLSNGHDRALIGHDQALELAQQAVQKEWSVRELERKAKAGASATTGSSNHGHGSDYMQNDPNTKDLEHKLLEATGMRSKISHKDEKGSLTLFFDSLIDLDRAIDRLCTPSQMQLEEANVNEDFPIIHENLE